MSQHSDLRELLRIAAARGVQWVSDSLQAQGAALVPRVWMVWANDYEVSGPTAVYAKESDAIVHESAFSDLEVREYELDELPDYLKAGEKYWQVLLNLETGEVLRQCKYDSTKTREAHVSVSQKKQPKDILDEETQQAVVLPPQPFVLRWVGWALDDQVLRLAEEARQNWVARNGLKTSADLEKNLCARRINQVVESHEHVVDRHARMILEDAYRQFSEPVIEQLVMDELTGPATELKDKGVLSLRSLKEIHERRGELCEHGYSKRWTDTHGTPVCDQCPKEDK